MVRVVLLGGCAAYDGAGAVVPLVGKPMALLARLCLAGEQGLGRAALAELLWGDRDEGSARHSLRQALTTLRRVLRLAGGTLPEGAGERIVLPLAGLDVDVRRFERAVDLADPAALSAACAAYGGPFLGVFRSGSASFEEWADRERYRLEAMAIRMQGRLVRLLEDRGDLDAAVPAAERLVELAPLEEEAHAALVRLLAARGEMALARAAHRRCQELFARELGQPSAIVAPPVEPGPVPPPAIAPPPTPAPPRRGRRRTSGILLAVAGSAAVVAVLFWFLLVAPSVPAPPPASVAVLPFRNAGGDPGGSVLADGIAEDVIGLLARSRDLTVIGRHSSFAVRDEAGDPGAVGRKLGVRYLVEGSTRRDGDRLEVSARLIDAASGASLWSQDWARSEADLFKVQREIAFAVAGTLLPTVRAAATAATRRTPTTSLSAHELYLQGAEAKHIFDAEHNRKAQDLLRRATEADPGYSDAWALRGYALYVDWLFALTGPRRPEALDEAQRYVIRGRQLDPTLPLAYQALSEIYLARGEPEAARAAAAKAVELAPSDPESLIKLADVLGFMGRNEDSVRLGREALRLNPIAPDYYYGIIAPGLYLTGRYEEAAGLLRPCIDQDPGHPNCLIFGALSKIELGRYEQAKADLNRLAALFPGVRLQEKFSAAEGWSAADLERIWTGFARVGVRADRERS